jgi:molecular chaperone GrpE (heat shock protein)
LTPFVAADAEPFDAQRHQVIEGEGKAPADAVIEGTIAAGYTFQGRLLRPALVRVRGNGAEQPAAAESIGPQEAPKSSDQ